MTRQPAQAAASRWPKPSQPKGGTPGDQGTRPEALGPQAPTAAGTLGDRARTTLLS